MTPKRPLTEIRLEAPAASPEITMIPSCKCGGCPRVLTASDSLHRGYGPKCYAKAFGETQYARLEAQGQMPMWPISSEESATPQ